MAELLTSDVRGVCSTRLRAVVAYGPALDGATDAPLSCLALVKMFESGGRGIGDSDRDNGLLILASVRNRRVWIEVGYWGFEGRW